MVLRWEVPSELLMARSMFSESWLRMAEMLEEASRFRVTDSPSKLLIC